MCFFHLFRGIGLTGLICFLGYFFSGRIPIGWVSSSIIIGFLFSNIVGLKGYFIPGVNFGEKHVLSLAIILLGSQLDFSILYQLGFETLAIVVLVVSFTVGLGFYIGGRFRISRTLSLLLGVGTGVCGASAIAAISKTVNASKEDTGLSIALVNLIGSFGIAVMTMLTLALNLENNQAGVVIGGTLQAVGHVTAAGFGINPEVGAMATVVKMTRILLLGPLIIVLGFFLNGRGQNNFNIRDVPFFILGFVLMMFATNLNFFNELIQSSLSYFAKITLVFAMAAVGLKIQLKDITDKGLNALACASAIFTIQVVFCLVLTLTFIE